MRIQTGSFESTRKRSGTPILLDNVESLIGARFTQRATFDVRTNDLPTMSRLERMLHVEHPRIYLRCRFNDLNNVVQTLASNA